MTIDPGDPFTPGTLRFQARAQLLAALEAFLDEVARSSRDRKLRDFPEFDEVRRAHLQWTVYGRDGE